MKNRAGNGRSGGGVAFSRCSALTWVAVAATMILASTYWLVHNHIIDGDISLSHVDESLNVAKLLRNSEINKGDYAFAKA